MSRSGPHCKWREEFEDEKRIDPHLSTSQSNGPQKSISLFLPFILVVIFVWPGAAKLVNSAALGGSIAMFQILPVAWINVLTLGLQAYEILPGVTALIRGEMAVGCLVFVALLSGLFWGCLGTTVVSERVEICPPLSDLYDGRYEIFLLGCNARSDILEKSRAETK